MEEEPKKPKKLQSHDAKKRKLDKVQPDSKSESKSTGSKVGSESVSKKPKKNALIAPPPRIADRKATVPNLRQSQTAPRNLGADFKFTDDEDEGVDESKLELPNWMLPHNIRDKNGLRPNEKGYNKNTIMIPASEKIDCPPIIKQYFDVKANHWDKIVAFKVWKFYYFYFNDALIVKRLCDLPIYVKNRRFFCFISEQSLNKHAALLIEKGHKIALAEQMEETVHKTSELIRREVCQILTRGTFFENQKLDYSSQFIMCLYQEKDLFDFGVVFFDCTTHEFHIGQFKDDPHFSNLRTLVTRIKPVEIVHLTNNINKEVILLLQSLSSKPTITKQGATGYPKRLVDVYKNLEDIFNPRGDKKKLPMLLEEMRGSVMADLKRFPNADEDKQRRIEKKNANFYTVQTLSICVEYLRGIMLLNTVFVMGQFLPYDLALEKHATLYMDCQALDNLEVLEVPYINLLTESQSLFGYMDKTTTPFGKRMFKRWLSSPLLDPTKIKERQEAVDDLINNQDIADYFQDQIARLPDLEKTIGKVYNLTNKKKMSAVYFEDFAKNRLMDFMKFLVELKKVEEIVETFQDYVPGFASQRLIELCSFKEVDIEAFKKKQKTNGKKNPPQVGIFPRINHIIEDLERMVKVENEIPVPAPGVNAHTDQIIEKMTTIKDKLDDILERYQKQFGKEVQYVNAKQRYEIEFPEDCFTDAKPRPKELAVISKRQGYIRYTSEEVEDHVYRLWVLECDFQRVLIEFIIDYFKSFYERHALWQQVILCLGELDCLCSLAKLARDMPKRCKPEVLPATDKTVFELTGMVHPCIASKNENFVPNDVVVQDDAPIFLITGPNMGGKSTLLRQTCLAVIMAQVGSYVPADSFKFTAKDRIFTRIGASDRILEGKSTFFIEMEETYNIVKEATKHSLLIIDELGRGTSTYDGVSLAYSTLKYLAEKLKCVTLFATHYHLLIEEFKMYKVIKNFYMESLYDETEDKVKFLYKFSPGEAHRSFGIQIAKHAGLPDKVIERANEKASFMTKEKKNISKEQAFLTYFNKSISLLDKVESTPSEEIKDLIKDLTSSILKLNNF